MCYCRAEILCIRRQLFIFFSSLPALRRSAAFEFDLGSLCQCLKGILFTPFIFSLTEMCTSVNTLDTSVPWHSIKDRCHHNFLQICSVLYRKILLKNNIYFVFSVRTLMSMWNGSFFFSFTITNVQLTPCTNCNWLMLIRFKLHISLWDPIILFIVVVCSVALPLHFEKLSGVNEFYRNMRNAMRQ